MLENERAKKFRVRVDADFKVDRLDRKIYDTASAAQCVLDRCLVLYPAISRGEVQYQREDGTWLKY